MKIAGIDWSMSAPSITIYEYSKDFNFTNCYSYFLTDKKKYILNDDLYHIYSDYIPKDYVNNEDRWEQYAKWGMKILKDCDKCLIEGFSFGSISSMFAQICENAAIIKNKIYLANIPLVIAEPSKIKKFATTKGNANKELMFKCFYDETNIDLKMLYNMSPNQWEPLAGVIDSYYMCKYLKYIQ